MNWLASQLQLLIERPSVAVVQSLSHVQLFETLRTVARCPWDSPGKNPGVGCHFFFEGLSPTQGSNPRLLHCRQILHHWATREAPERHSEELLKWKDFKGKRDETRKSKTKGNISGEVTFLWGKGGGLSPEDDFTRVDQEIPEWLI